jgi:RimJ/RimL family protein N-acetyltransferase
MIYGFNTLNLDRIELRVIDNNIRAKEIYKRLGFAEEGRLRRAAFVNGKPVDVMIMGLLREDFRPSH